MRRLYYIYACAAIALAGCSSGAGGPRPSSENYIEPPAMPVAGPLAPGPNLKTVQPRHTLQPKRTKCPPGKHWVRTHRAPGAAGATRYVPGRCAP